ncbi:MAG: transposase family protein [Actinoallomurus sp.]
MTTREEPLYGKAITGLEPDQLVELTSRLEELIIWDRGIGRPRALSLLEATAAVCMYLRNNVTEDVVAEVFGCSQPVVSRAITTPEGLIGDLLADYVPDPQEAIKSGALLVDGTLAPCWSWRDHPEPYSGKHKTTGHNLQIVTDMNGDIEVVSEPSPGSWHDAHAHDEAGLRTLLNGQGLGDKGYVGSGMITPYKKPKGGHLRDWQKDFNRQIDRVRAAVERGIANLKTWRILHTDYRRPLHTFKKACRAVIALYFYAAFE